MTKDKLLKIVLVGGGSAGPVAPLLAVAEEIRRELPHVEFWFLGTKKGPEAHMAGQARMHVIAIPAGRLRRYFSFATALAPLLIFFGFLKSLYILHKIKPDVAFGAGGYVQVPVLWAAWLLRIPVIIHQQDVAPTLSNTLCAPIAKKITVSFEHSKKDFYQGIGIFAGKQTSKVTYTGNPFREHLRQATKDEAVKFFKLDPSLPTLLAFGGGTGAQYLNSLVLDALPELTKNLQIIHATGKGKGLPTVSGRYHPYEFIDRMDLAYRASDIVLARAGLSTMTELSNLGKASIIIPIPGSHQERNAALLWSKKAAIVKDQSLFTSRNLILLIASLLENDHERNQLAQNMKTLMPAHAAQKVADIIIENSRQ